MRKEELLAWIGVVLAIPPLIYMIWAEGKWSSAAFVVLVIAGLMREYFADRRRENLPPFTALLVKKKIVMEDPTAQKVPFEALYRLRANQRTIYFVTAWLGGDGRIENILVDKAAPDRIEKKGSRIEITKRFDHELSPGEEVDVTVTYDHIGSFPGRPEGSRMLEGFTHTVEFETHAVSMEVTFHPQKPCLSGELLKRYSGSVKNAGKYTRAADGSRLDTDITHPTQGG